MLYDFNEIIKAFNVKGSIKEVEQIDTGLINQTFKVTLEDNSKYIIQRINHNVFKDIDGLMDNVFNVTSFLKEKGLTERYALKFLLTKEGKHYFRKDDSYFRMYIYVDNALTYDTSEDLSIIKEIGKGFGNFQNLLHDFPINTLNDTIVDFHNTPKRYEQLEKAKEVNYQNRLEECLDLYNKYLEVKDIACQISTLNLPLRVTHNDTKCNNVLIDENTHKSLAVIDLDTIMPGLSVFDFGDSIRSIATSVIDTRKDYDKASLRLDKYEAYTKGFLSQVKSSLTKLEIENLSLGAITMTIECGVRFLTDYLNGDTYFKTKYEKHNLFRAYSQINLALSMIENKKEMDEIIKKCLK